MLYFAAELEARDVEVIAELRAAHEALRRQSAVPKRWSGGVRQQLWSRAIKGSNTIEGYNVTDAQALAIVNDLTASDSEDLSVRVVTAYKQAMDLLLTQIADPTFMWHPSLLKAMHHIMLNYDQAKRPGLYRQSQIFVLDEQSNQKVYEGAPWEDVSSLVHDLVVQLDANRDTDPYVNAAMAHLNLVLIHPFADGNGRMSRALQTLILGRSKIADPEQLSIEEWLGSNTPDYYAVLQKVGQGNWAPHSETLMWIRFNLRAHALQLDSVQRRIRQANELWSSIEEALAAVHISERCADSLQHVAYGLELRRADHISLTGVDERTATRDFHALAKAGLVIQQGATRGTYYTTGPSLAKLLSKHSHPARTALADPYPDLRAELYR